MPIDDKHPQYEQMAERWQRCRDLTDGADAVKARGETYLPCPPGMDGLYEYPPYAARALFFNAMSRTVDGLAGSVMQKPPTVTVPSRVEPWLSDVTLDDRSLEGLTLEALREVLTVGRSVLLVDHTAEGAAEPRPYVARYRAEDLVSWQTARLEGDRVLVRAVLREQVAQPDPEDLSRISEQTQYRELLLTDEREYQQRVWVRLPAAHLRNSGFVMWAPSPWMTPTRRGEALPFIPLTIVNASSIGAGVERPPLVDLADVNLSHYRSSADREHALYWVSMPTPWVAGAKGDGPLRIGSSVAWDLETDGKAGMLEHSGEGIGAIEKVMEEKMRLMATLGARLLEAQPRQAETATAVSMRHAGEHASLRTVAQVVEAGLTKTMQWMAWWAGTEDRPADTEASVELNKDFVAIRATPDEVKAAMLAWQAGGMSFDTWYHNLVTGEWARPGVTVEEEREAIAREGV
jgi:hypothetical protein